MTFGGSTGHSASPPVYGRCGVAGYDLDGIADAMAAMRRMDEIKPVILPG